MAEPESALETLLREFPLATAVRQAGTLWHYTDAYGLEGMLRERAIRATSFAHLNDSSELLHGEESVELTAKEMVKGTDGFTRRLLTEFIDTWETNRLSAALNVYVASFCADDGDRLSQWRAYGNNGVGYSIGLPSLPEPAVDADSTRKLAASLVKMSYSPGKLEKPVVRRFRDICARATAISKQDEESVCAAGLQVLRMHAASLSVYLKHSGFKEENEWRIVASVPKGEVTDEESIVKHRPTSRGIVPYVNVPLAEELPRIPIFKIYVGPGPDPQARAAAVVSLLTSLKYDNPESLVVNSHIPYRT